MDNLNELLGVAKEDCQSLRDDQPYPCRAADAEFIQFQRDNPTVYPKFRMLAVKLKAKGIDRWGAKAIWEVLRYEMALKSVTTGEKYALNNNFTSRFARKLMTEEPEEFAGFFETRTLKGGEISSPSREAPMSNVIRAAATPRPPTGAPSTCFTACTGSDYGRLTSGL